MAYRQDLSQAQNGTVTGRGGNAQQLGPAALRRLQSMGVVGGGAGGQTPGIVPDMPPPAGGWGGGPQSLDGQNVQDYANVGPATKSPFTPGGDVSVNDAGSGGILGQLQSHTATDSMPTGFHAPPGYGPSAGAIASGGGLRIDPGFAGGTNQAGGGGNTFPMPQSMMPQEPFQVPGQQPPTPGSPNIQAAIQGIRAQLGAPKPGATGGAGTPWQSPPIARVGGPNTQFPTKPQGGQKPQMGPISEVPYKPSTGPMGPTPTVGGPGGVPSAGGAQSPVAPKPMTGGVAPNPITDILKQRMMQNPGMAGRQSQHV